MHPVIATLLNSPTSIATAESCTGGQLAAALTAAPGSSAYFHWGAVTYSNAAKRSMLGVSPQTLDCEGAVSDAVVREMAQGARRYSGCQVAIATSGVAGPGGGSPTKPVGLVWMALASAGGCVSFQRVFSGDRAAIQSAAVAACLDALAEHLAAVGAPAPVQPSHSPDPS
ncbi:nicotinamide-nucleotide amidohydrolase family protein [Litorivicinus lipolyticus]|uniref:Nicotinamide-nucleotide amidohydrolase family protein n=1 Tax=Litorivicinus lipolyticus TaxID=418701 RepID=A0A5Q2QDR0_9GAMM|nr:CinA family protein [Litorivicinus lipolyticus]QGG79990.1 nicotinamide-nucleotide amidohydrolase family protein [Litorivicinus lipolyticus]